MKAICLLSKCCGQNSEQWDRVSVPQHSITRPENAPPSATPQDPCGPSGHQAPSARRHEVICAVLEYAAATRDPFTETNTVKSESKTMWCALFATWL
ncbi:hypothetical protein V5799_013763 [Amblyomma americanum]|uniref:Uncharacterized protein n=1 Tax=Amblyomma americanum TaxID=6943 RepID=A0AAQ4E549_AMBAM